MKRIHDLLCLRFRGELKEEPSYWLNMTGHQFEAKLTQLLRQRGYLTPA